MRLLRALLAIVALASQLASGAVAAPERGADPLARLHAVMVLCHAPAMGVAARGDAGHREHRHLACPMPVSLALPGAILAPVAPVPIGAPGFVVRAEVRRAARAPPGRGVAVPPATGPPVLL